MVRRGGKMGTQDLGPSLCSLLREFLHSGTGILLHKEAQPRRLVGAEIHPKPVHQVSILVWVGMPQGDRVSGILMQGTCGLYVF